MTVTHQEPTVGEEDSVGDFFILQRSGHLYQIRKTLLLFTLANLTTGNTHYNDDHKDLKGIFAGDRHRFLKLTQPFTIIP